MNDSKTPSSERNQGEGNRDADRNYREAVRRFVEQGRVAPAAAAAQAAVDGDEAPALEAAEIAGKQRIAENESEKGSGPLPSFWSPKQESAWQRVGEALRRDWLQTKADLGLGSGIELGQTATDTMKQAAGVSALPGGQDAGVDWDLARHAIRLGHGAATYWIDDDAWTAEVEARVQREWDGMGTGIAWEHAAPLVRHGWEQGRKDVSSTS